MRFDAMSAPVTIAFRIHTDDGEQPSVFQLTVGEAQDLIAVLEKAITRVARNEEAA